MRDNEEYMTQETGEKTEHKTGEKEEDIGEEEDVFERRDPLELFGSDIMMMILNCLDARSVALSLVVSRKWHGVASSDRLWSSKVCIIQ